MTFALGIFDLFTYAIPGVLQLSLLAYIAARLHWIDLGAVLSGPGALVFAGVAIVGYLLGHLTYAFAGALDRLPPKRRDIIAARAAFESRNPAARGRPFVSAHTGLLFAAIELHNREAAAEVARLQAVGLMVRNSAIPLAGGAVVAVVELIAGDSRAFAACAAVLLAGLTVAAVNRGQRLRSWATVKTLELAFWVPDIDEKVRVREEPPARAG
jgi:hypothetical protein